MHKDVKVELKEESDSGALAAEAETQPTRRRRKWLLVGTAVVLPVVAVLVWLLIPALRRSEPEMRVWFF